MSAPYGPLDVTSPFLPTTRVFPEDISQLLIVLTNIYSSIAQAVNQREISSFNLNEQLNGQNFYNPANIQIPRQCFRQCFLIGSISPGSSFVISPSASTPTPTDITLGVHMYGGIITDVPDYRPLPYVDVTAVTNQVSVTVTQDSVTLQTTITVKNGSTAPSITSGYLVLEYLKN